MESDNGAFMEKFTLPPSSSSGDLPLSGLTFAVKDIFDMEGLVTGFGNPDWARTHTKANSTAPAVLALLRAGATCVGKTIMDEMAYSINGENIHYGTPKNPCAADRIPGGSSSGSAVAVGTDTGGSVRVPAAFCKIYGIRPSHGVVSVDGVVPMAQSFDTVGWFARDPSILKRVGNVLLPPLDPHLVSPSPVIIAEDCFKLLNIPIDRVKQILVKSVEKIFGGQVLKYMDLGDYVEENVSSLKHFMGQGGDTKEYSIPSLVALSSAMRILQRHEFKINHGKWVSSIKPNLGPGLKERIWEAVFSNDDKIDICHSIKTELRMALTSLLGDAGILAIPTVPGPPPKLQTQPSTLETFRARAFSLLSIAGVSGFCQVSIPLGLYDGLPVSVSLLAKHGSDMFLLNLVETLCETLKEHMLNIDATVNSNL
ncbi:amidase 1-like isoform X2 [Chenopodium quinoa]|uniref:amidase 1-like isoform X2 n=1 Tax=Chenopodium quinoa TaxID=63459 RepID=UPI000B773623|nr:amidase 1-like isoform X2 [Chenopodium quinoa]